MKSVIVIAMIAVLVSCTYSQTEKGNNKVTKINKSDEEWKKELTEEQYKVLRCSATEAPFTGKYYYHKEKGIYTCAACGNELFSSETKYESGSGWPSYYDVISDTSVTTEKDYSLGMERIEVKCAKCDSHLGHVFPDGPKPTNLRYCINSAAMGFKKK